MFLSIALSGWHGHRPARTHGTRRSACDANKEQLLLLCDATTEV